MAKKSVSLAVGRGEKLPTDKGAGLTAKGRAERFCVFCAVNISHKRSDAKFCSRGHKNLFSDRQRNYAAEYAKNADVRRTQSLAYYHADVEKSRAKQRNRQKQNPSVYAAITAKRRAAKLLRTPRWLSDNDLRSIKKLYELAAEQTAKTGVKWHVDHIIPLQGRGVSGLHVPWNLQLLPAAKNIAKHNRYEAP